MPWYALKSRSPFRLEHHLLDRVDLIFLPQETRHTIDGRKIRHAIIPGVLFIMTDKENALRLEQTSHDPLTAIPPFRIYRYEGERDIAEIRPRDIALLRLLTAQDATRCEIYEKKDFKKGQPVRVTGGIFKGQTGFVQRVKKNRHVVVQIEGLCAILLPFIHPDLLSPIEF